MAVGNAAVRQARHWLGVRKIPNDIIKPRDLANISEELGVGFKETMGHLVTLADIGGEDEESARRSEGKG